MPWGLRALRRPRESGPTPKPEQSSLRTRLLLAILFLIPTSHSRIPPPLSRENTPPGCLLSHLHLGHGPPGRLTASFPTKPKHFSPGTSRGQLRMCHRYSLLFPNIPTATPSAAHPDPREGNGRVLGRLSVELSGNSVILPANTGHWSMFTLRWTKMAEI